MKQISILIVVDSLSALATNQLQKNVYLVDSNQYLGSWQEGTDQLHTLCQDGQHIIWRAQAISPSNNVEISSFSGDALSQKICNPVRHDSIGQTSWDAQIQTRGSIGSYPYTISLSIDGRNLQFSPYLKVI